MRIDVRAGGTSSCLWYARSAQQTCAGMQVIVLSFTTIIGLMIGTFFVVLKAGGVHFNE